VDLPQSSEQIRRLVAAEKLVFEFFAGADGYFLRRICLAPNSACASVDAATSLDPNNVFVSRSELMFPAKQSLESLYRSNAQKLRTFVRGRVGVQEAEDIVQDTFLRALQDNTVRSAHQPSAYLVCIARNLVIDARRRAKVRSRCVDEYVTQIMTTSSDPFRASNPIGARELRICVTCVPESCREVFVLYWVHGLDHGEVAERVGVTRRTVERRLAKAQKKLEQDFG
jgi:RNA polymerase sigma-70 factor (ECF subfamily)